MRLTPSPPSVILGLDAGGLSLDGKDARVPGAVFGYVLEGECELGIDDQPARTLKAGETFYEPGGALHRVSRNPSTRARTRVLAVTLHPRDAGELVAPAGKE